MSDKYNLQLSGSGDHGDVMSRACAEARAKGIKIHYIEGWANENTSTRLRVEDANGYWLKSFNCGYPFDAWDRCLEFIENYLDVAR